MAECVVHHSVPLWRPAERGRLGLHVLRVGKAANPYELSTVLTHPHAFYFDTVLLLQGNDGLGEKLYPLGARELKGQANPSKKLDPRKED